jgi:membrane protein
VGERPTTLAAALAYYSLFSFAPAIFLGLTIAGFFLNEQEIAARLLERVEETFGPDVAEFILDAVFSISQSTSDSSALISIIGFIALFLAASMLFFQLQYALNTIWKVPPPKQGTTLSLVKNRLLAFGMVIGIGVLIIVSAILSMISTLFYSLIGWENPLQLFNTLGAIGLLTISFALIYKILPEVEIRWRDVWIGSAVTAVLVVLGVWLLGLYLKSARVTSALEAAGTVAVLLITFYILAQIFLFGAVFTRVYASIFGKKIIPKQAEQASDKERKNEVEPE